MRFTLLNRLAYSTGCNSSGRNLSFPVPITFISLFVLMAGCNSGKEAAEVPEAKVTGDTVIMATNSPQLAALTIELVGAEQAAYLPLTGRLVWDEDATVRVFTPFAGIVRKLFVDVNLPVTNGMPLPEIQSTAEKPPFSERG
jgi:membrane fusion protein, heavy metal efflux system